MIWMLAMAVGGYGLLLGGMAVAQRRMIYHPGPLGRSPAAAGVPEMAAVSVRTGDGLVLGGWYAAGRRPATIVLFHGNTGSLADRAHKARVLLDAGFGVFLAGYRGFGGNDGAPDEAGLYADARAALVWLGGQGVAPGAIAVYGESLGTGVAVQMAVEGPVGAVVLEAPYTSLPELAPTMVPLALARLLMRDHFASLAKIRRVAAPLLIVHGEQDRVVPVTMGRRLLAAAPAGEALFPAAAGHNDVWQHGAGAAVIAFLTRSLA